MIENAYEATNEHDDGSVDKLVVFVRSDGSMEIDVDGSNCGCHIFRVEPADVANIVKWLSALGSPHPGEAEATK